MSKLIALVATAVVVNGERTVIQPGEPLPDLGAHDQRALLASGAAQDSATQAEQDAQTAQAVAAAEANFAAARQSVQEEAASTQGPAESTEAKKPAKKKE